MVIGLHDLWHIAWGISSSLQRYCNVKSHKYAPPPPFCMLASGKTGEGVYVQDRDISMWWPLPTNDRHVDTRSSYINWLFDGENNNVSFDMTYSYGFKGLSVHIARFHSQIRTGGGAYLWDKIPVKELWLKLGGGFIRERGHIHGTLR